MVHGRSARRPYCELDPVDIVRVQDGVLAEPLGRAPEKRPRAIEEWRSLFGKTFPSK